MAMMTRAFASAGTDVARRVYAGLTQPGSRITSGRWAVASRSIRASSGRQGTPAVVSSANRASVPARPDAYAITRRSTPGRAASARQHAAMYPDTSGQQIRMRIGRMG